MPGRSALRSRLLCGWLIAGALAQAGCAQAGSPGVSPREAAELGVGTGRITVACGTADELRAFGGAHPAGLAAQESIALSGVRSVAAVYRRDQTHFYQGESVGSVIHDTISLLGGCGLFRAQRTLIRILRHR